MHATNDLFVTIILFTFLSQGGLGMKRKSGIRQPEEFAICSGHVDRGTPPVPFATQAIGRVTGMKTSNRSPPLLEAYFSRRVSTTSKSSSRVAIANRAWWRIPHLNGCDGATPQPQWVLPYMYVVGVTISRLKTRASGMTSSIVCGKMTYHR